MNALVGFYFGVMFYDALVRFLNTTSGGFGFGTLFYNAPALKSCEAPVLYDNMTHQAGVYRVHGVWCANVLCTLLLSLVERTSVT